MIDEKDLNSPTDNDGFADDSSDNEAFRLESLERYPDAVPFEFDEEEEDPATNSDDSAQLPAATLAAIKSDLDKSRRRKAKPDTLSLSLDRLRKVLQTTSPEEAEFTIESDPLLVDQLAGKPEFSSTDITISERPVITERKPVKTTDDANPLDIDDGDTEQASQSQKASAKKSAGTSSNSQKSSSKKKRRALPLIPVAIGVGVLVATVGGYLAYKAINSKSGDTRSGNGATESTAAKQPAGSVSSPSEKTTKESSAELRSETPAQPEALTHDAAQTPPPTHAKGASGTDDHAATPSHSSGETKVTAMPPKQSAAHGLHVGEAAHTGSPGSQTSAHGLEAKRQVVAQQSHQGSHKSSKQVLKQVLKQAPMQAHSQTAKQASPEASTSKKTAAATLPASTSSHRASSNARTGAAMAARFGGTEDHGLKQKQEPKIASRTSSSTKLAEHSPPALSVAKSEAGAGHQATPRPEIIPPPRVNLKAGNASTAQYSVQVLSTAYRQDAERRLQQIQLRSISGGYISEQQVRGRTVYNVRFGMFRTKEDAEVALMRHGVSGASICRLR